MTDIIKNFVELKARDAVKLVKQSPTLLAQNISNFRDEMNDLGCHRPLIFAFGGDAFDLIKNNLQSHEYSGLIKLTHYSHQIGKDNYKRDELARIDEGLGSAS
jgi:hypothetical protein